MNVQHSILSATICLALSWIAALPAAANSAMQDLFENVSLCGEGGISEARASAQAHASSTGENLGYHSIGLEEQTFTSEFTPPEFPEGMQGSYVYGLAIFSDDGCELSIDGRKVHERYRKGQALPRLDQSFYDLPVLLTPGEPVQIELKYSNVHFITRAGYADIDGVTLYLYRVKAGIIPDYNRDGVINDDDRGKVTKANPWRWWINDDKDSGDYQEDAGSNLPGQPGGNFSDTVINGVTDLIDFYPLWLDIKEVIQKYPPDQYEYRLSNNDGALNLALAPDLNPGGDPDVDAAGAYWRALDWATAYKNLPVQRMTQDGTALSPAFMQLLQQKKGIVLVESAKAGNSPLNLDIYRADEKQCTISFQQQSDQALKMFRHLTLYEATGNPTAQLNDTGESENYPDELTNNKAFVMLHGYSSRPNGEEHNKVQRAFNSEIFKRLHQSGSRAKYVAAYWDSATSLDYHQSAYNAFKTSSVVAQKLGALGANEIIAGAHSLGNIVISNAVCHEGFRPRHYFMINAASPIEAYAPTQTQGNSRRLMSEAMTEREWKQYDMAFYSPNWHSQFPTSDARHKLKWKGRFQEAGSLTNVYNFYSTGEDVVADPLTDDVNVMRTIWEKFTKDQSVGRYAWASQEFIKGGTSIVSVAFKRNHGGWQHIGPRGSTLAHRFMGTINASTPLGQYDLYTPEVSNNMLKNETYTREHLAQFGLFKRFESPLYDALYAPINDNNDTWTDDAGFKWNNPFTQKQASELAATRETQWVLLSSALPSISFAAAANNVTGINGINMMSIKNGWPKTGRELSREQDWQHGDFYIIGATYVKNMHLKLVNEGMLDE